MQPTDAVKRRNPPPESHATSPRQVPKSGKPAPVPTKPLPPRQAPRKATSGHVGRDQPAAPQARAPAAKPAFVEIPRSGVAEEEAGQGAKEWAGPRMEHPSWSLQEPEAGRPERRDTPAATGSGGTVPPAAWQPPSASRVSAAASEEPAEVRARGDPANAARLASLQPDLAHPSTLIETLAADIVVSDDMAVPAISTRQAHKPLKSAAGDVEKIWRAQHHGD